VEKMCDGAKKKGRALKWKCSRVSSSSSRGHPSKLPHKCRKSKRATLVQREKILPNGGDISKQKCFQALTIQNYKKLKY